LTAVAILAVFAGCRAAEPPEVVRARSQREYLLSQIASLQELEARARRGDLVTTNRIAVGVDEKVAQDLLNAPLPQEIEIEKRVRIRLESAHSFFRGQQAALIFRARAVSLDAPAAFARIELGGGLEDFRLRDGHLTGRVRLYHFVLLDSTIGSLGRGVVEALFRNNLGAIEQQSEDRASRPHRAVGQDREGDHGAGDGPARKLPLRIGARRSCR
jgi:hypothetical protein